MLSDLDGAGARPCGLAHSVLPTSLCATAMPAAKLSGSQAAGNARLAAVQFGCDSTRRQWIGGGPAGVPSGPDELAEEGTRSYMSQPAVRLDNLVKGHLDFSIKCKTLATAKDAEDARIDGTSRVRFCSAFIAYLPQSALPAVRYFLSIPLRPWCFLR